MNVASSDRDPKQKLAGSAIAIVATFISTVLFFSRLCLEVWQNSVDVVFWDQWDFFLPFFEGRNPWDAFRFLLGPHRQGLGSAVIAVSNGASDWNTRVLAIVTTSLLLVAMLLALRLKVVLYGRLTVWDALIPPIFFRLSQYQSLASIPNPAHGALPVLLLVCGCFVMTIESRVRQALVFPLFAFVAMHTGFGNLIPGVVGIALLLRMTTELRAGEKRAAALTAITGFGVLLASLTFFPGFRTKNIVLPCDGATPGVNEWAAWVVTQIGQYWGVADFPLPLFPGLTLFVLVPAIALVACALIGLDTNKSLQSLREWSRSAVPLVLISYSLIFSVVSGVGRLCGGVGYALSSRYVTHMIPLALGLYLIWAWSTEVASGRRSLRLSAGGVMAAFVLWGAIYVTPSYERELDVENLKKRQWAQCLRKGGEPFACSVSTNFRPFPIPHMIDDRVEYLRKRHLSFFSDDWE